jgi:predicted nucleotidyltransferase
MQEAMDKADKTAVAEAFYREVLQLLNESKIPFMLGGGFALRHYTGIYRDIKDLDLFCKGGDYTRILMFFAEHGFQTELTDVRWLAKIVKGDHFVDLIFNTVNNICTVDDVWFEHSVESELFGMPVRLIPVEEMIWCKIYVQNRERYDGSDVNHAILKQGRTLDWKRLWGRIEQHWHLLFAQILSFQFVYPTERDIIPSWLYDQLLELAKGQYNLPTPVEKVCLGPIIDQTQYGVDVKEWGYKVTTMRTV